MLEAEAEDSRGQNFVLEALKSLFALLYLGQLCERE